MSEYKTAQANWHTILLEGATILRDLPARPFTLVWDGDETEIRTGVYMGPVLVDLRLEPTQPPTQAGDIWEDVAELSIEVGALLTIRGPWDNEPACTLALDPGIYRMRVSATGRDVAYDLAVRQPTERYLVHIWRAPEAPFRVVKATTSV